MFQFGTKLLFRYCFEKLKLIKMFLKCSFAQLSLKCTFVKHKNSHHFCFVQYGNSFHFCSVQTRILIIFVLFSPIILIIFILLSTRILLTFALFSTKIVMIFWNGLSWDVVLRLIKFSIKKFNIYKNCKRFPNEEISAVRLKLTGSWTTGPED